MGGGRMPEMEEMKTPEKKAEGGIARGARRLALAFGLMVAAARGVHAGERLDMLKSKHPEIAASLEKMSQAADFAASEDEDKDTKKSELPQSGESKDTSK